MAKTVTCPTCGKPVAWAPESRWRPFCSERCRLIDLGDWLEEKHRIVEPSEDAAWPPSDQEDGPRAH